MRFFLIMIGFVQVIVVLTAAAVGTHFLDDQKLENIIWIAAIALCICFMGACIGLARRIDE